MEYSISRVKRNIIILSAVFLIVKSISLGITFIFIEPVNLDQNLRVILTILGIIAYGYIMLAFVDYFRYYGLKILQIITLIFLLIEILGSVIQFTKMAEMNIPKLIPFANGVIWIFTIITWIIFLFQTPMKNSSALISIRKYAIAILAALFINATFPILIVRLTDSYKYFELTIAIITPIAYVFAIDFARKIQLEE